MASEAMERRVQMVRAALMEYGRPDLAEAIAVRGTVFGIAPTAQVPGFLVEDAPIYYRAVRLAYQSYRKPIGCYDCWFAYANAEAPFPRGCEHVD